MQFHSALSHVPSRSTTVLHPDLCRTAALVLCDLDGCLVSEGRAYPDAAEFVRACGERLWIVSNNSSDTAVTLSETLAALDLDIPPDRILLAGEQTIRHLAQQQPGARLNVYGTPVLRMAAHLSGFAHDDRPPQLALLCRDPRLTIESITHLAADIEHGAAFWVANTDITHPGWNGRTIAETGVLLAALRAMVPNAQYSCLGKPDPFLIAAALEATGITAEQAVFIGDNALTDGEAAWAATIPFIHLVRNRSAG